MECGRVFSFDRYIFRMKFPVALHIEIYTASRGFLATARLLYFLSYGPVLMWLVSLEARCNRPVWSCRPARPIYVLPVLPRTNTKLGDRSFAAAGPRLWNSLPGPLRQAQTLATFKTQ